MPESPTRKTNFFQRSASTVSVIEMSTPRLLGGVREGGELFVGLAVDAGRSAFWAKSLVWLTVPGADMTLAI